MPTSKMSSDDLGNRPINQSTRPYDTPAQNTPTQSPDYTGQGGAGYANEPAQKQSFLQRLGQAFAPANMGSISPMGGSTSWAGNFNPPKIQAPQQGTSGIDALSEAAPMVAMPLSGGASMPSAPLGAAPASAVPATKSAAPQNTGAHSGAGEWYSGPGAGQGRPSDAASGLTGAINYLNTDASGGGWMNAINALGAIADAYGAGKLAYAGVQSPTRLQQEYKMRLASQQKANEVESTLKAQLANLDAKTAADLKEAEANHDMDKWMQILVKAGINPYEMALVRAGTLREALNASSDPANMLSPEAFANKALGGEMGIR